MVFRLALIALVLLTSLSLGMARGQLRTGTELVLCGGMAVVTDPDDPGQASFCPDMALGLLAALDAPPLTVAPGAGPLRRADLPQAVRFSPLSQPVPQARGPPGAPRRRTEPFATSPSEFDLT